MKTYTPGEASDRLGIPGSTLRRYVKLFGDRLSEGARRARGRVFTDEDLQILAQVRTLTNKGVKLEEVPERLDLVRDDILDLPTNALDYPGIQKRIEDIFDIFTAQQADINELKRRLDEMEQKQRRSWWDRLRGK